MGQELLLGMPLVEQEALDLEPLAPLSAVAAVAAVVAVVVAAAVAAVGPPFAAVAGSVQKGYQ